MFLFCFFRMVYSQYTKESILKLFTEDNLRPPAITSILAQERQLVS